MRILLDTHVLLWALTEDKRLPAIASKMIEDLSNAIYCSVASLWEISIKHAVHPDLMPTDAETLKELCKEAGYELLSIEPRHIIALESLEAAGQKPIHHDPFDRILIAQAKSDSMVLLTADALISRYDESCILSLGSS